MLYTQADARYDSESVPGEPGIRCENCAYYEGDYNCSIVVGNILPGGHCEFFEVSDNPPDEDLSQSDEGSNEYPSPFNSFSSRADEKVSILDSADEQLSQCLSMDGSKLDAGLENVYSAYSAFPLD